MIDMSRIKADLTRFADVGTDVEIVASAISVQVRMQRNGAREYFIDKRSGRIQARHADDREYQSIESLFGSPEFADIERLLATQSRVYPIGNYSNHIDPEGHFIRNEDDRETKEPLSLDLLRRRLDSTSNRALRLILIDGSAGVGKTSLIGRLVAERAAGIGPRIPILHVTSRGRRLVSLDDAIAVSIQSLNIGSFGFPQVPTLVRYGLLQIAIDGFDELADPEGYRNSSYALSLFLEQAGDGGAVILAGRDTFFDAQNFRTALNRFGVKPPIETARLSPISTPRAVEWLNSQGWRLQRNSPTVGSFLAEGSLFLRPFFLARIAPLQSFEPLLDDAGDPWSFIVRDFVEREAEILAKALALDMPRVIDRLDALYSEAAADMAERERNRISVDILAFLCEVAFNDAVPADQIRTLQHRIESIALLEPQADPGESGSLVRGFPNEAIFNHFLARAIFRASAERSIPAFMRRSYLGLDVSEAFAQVLRTEDPETRKNVLLGLHTALEREGRAARLAINLGTMIITAAQFKMDRNEEIPEYSNLQAENIRWSGVTAPARITSSEIARFDVRTCDLRYTEFSDVSVGILAVDDLTSFGVTWPNVGSLHVVTHGNNVEMLHDPNAIQDWIKEHATDAANSTSADNDAPFVRYFDRLMMHFGRFHAAREGSGDQGGHLLADPKWPAVRRILERNSRLESFRRAARGPASEFFRVVEPYALIAPSEEDVESIKVRKEIVIESKLHS